MPEIKGDYQGILKTIKATEDAKLETVTAIEAGSAIIGNIDRVATVGHIDGLGSIGNVNRLNSSGTLKNIPWVWNDGLIDYSVIGMKNGGVIVSPGFTGLDWKPLAINTDGKLILDTLGTVERVNRIESFGTLNNIPYVWDVDFSAYYDLIAQNIGLVTSPGYDGGAYRPLSVNTDGELILDRLGTVERVKNIDNLGTVGEGHTYIEQYGTWGQLQGTVHGAYTIPKADRSDILYNLRCNRDRDLVTAPGWTGTRRVKLLTDEDWQLKTAPARSRKGVVQTVTNKGTAVALLASSTPAIGVIVKAVHDNLGTIYVGDSTVDDTHGFQLRRDEFISFSCQNAGSVYIDASRDNQKVSALYINY